MKPPKEAEMLHRMAACCSTAERCIQEIRRKIQTAGLPAEAAERIIATLIKERFIDENRFARSFVSDKLRFNRWGRIKIHYELGKRQIPSSICREALDGIDESAYLSVLYSLLEEKSKTVRGKDGREAFSKLLRFAAGRGFESEAAIRCLRRLYRENGYADDFE